MLFYSVVAEVGGYCDTHLGDVFGIFKGEDLLWRGLSSGKCWKVLGVNVVVGRNVKINGV